MWQQIWTKPCETKKHCNLQPTSVRATCVFSLKPSVRQFSHKLTCKSSNFSPCLSAPQNSRNCNNAISLTNVLLCLFTPYGEFGAGRVKEGFDLFYAPNSFNFAKIIPFYCFWVPKEHISMYNKGLSETAGAERDALSHIRKLPIISICLSYYLKDKGQRPLWAEFGLVFIYVS